MYFSQFLELCVALIT